MSETTRGGNAVSLDVCTPTAVRVCIAIPTFRREEMLRQLLDGIAAISVPDRISLKVLVIDNDDKPSASDVVTDRQRCFPFPLSYEYFGRAGLSLVRNFVIERTRGEFEFVAMIDDDEVPQVQWLSELLRVQSLTQADAVVGPVPRHIPDSAPRWLHAGHFFELPVYGDGETIRDGYSGNCLLRLASIERFGVRFDPALNFAGGEDLLFFRELVLAGGRLVYAAQAVAEESVEQKRLTFSYVMQLNFRRGNTLALCDLRIYRNGRMRAIRALKAVACILRGLNLLIPKSVLRGRAGSAAALCDVARGAGGIAALLGFTYDMYRRSDRVNP